tara:strand:+ start:249 stop:425 length:177 start_codon:yes stop_codon:yes gene_type:complete
MKKQKKLTPTWEEVQEQVNHALKSGLISWSDVPDINDSQASIAMVQRIQAIWATRKGN